MRKTKSTKWVASAAVVVGLLASTGVWAQAQQQPARPAAPAAPAAAKGAPAASPATPAEPQEAIPMVQGMPSEMDIIKMTAEREASRELVKSAQPQVSGNNAQVTVQVGSTMCTIALKKEAKKIGEVEFKNWVATGKQCK